MNDSVELEILRLTNSILLSREALAQIHIEAAIRPQVGEMVLSLEAKIAGKSNIKNDLVRYPADWWQHLKERFAPKWVLKYYPMVYTVVKMDVDVYYPSVQIPNHAPVIDFRRTAMLETEFDYNLAGPVPN